jgi:hypothetical protein
LRDGSHVAGLEYVTDVALYHPVDKTPYALRFQLRIINYELRFQLRISFNYELILNRVTS